MGPKGETSPRLIGIDARAASHPQPGGFKAYVENLIDGLGQVDHENSYILYLDRDVLEGRVPSRANFTSQVVPGAWPGFGMPWREQVALPRRMATDRIDLAHFPCATAPLFCPCPFIVTIHDVIEFLGRRQLSLYGRKMLERWPQQQAPKRILMHLYNWFVQAQAARQATAIITVSEHSKKDIVKTFGVPEDKIFVVYRAPSQTYRPLDNKRACETHIQVLGERYGLLDGYILAIGSPDPRKNVHTLLEAYSRLEPDLIARHQLAIVWTHSLLKVAIARKVVEMGLDKRVVFLEGVSDEELALLYNRAVLFAFPSLYEGFGLPPVEAMACGTPVVSSNAASLPEILGDAAFLVEPHDVGEWCAGLRQLLTGEEVRLALREKGRIRSQTFSGERQARETVAIYQHAVREQRG